MMAKTNAVLPNVFLDEFQFFDTLKPELCSGPIEKLTVNRINELREIPLFKMNNGKSDQTTVPKM